MHWRLLNIETKGLKNNMDKTLFVKITNNWINGVVTKKKEINFIIFLLRSNIKS